jgi:hypothetical protein
MAKISNQKSDLYKVPFRNMSGSTMPPYGVGLVTGYADEGAGLITAYVEESANDDVLEMLVNGPSSVASGAYGAGTIGQGPVPCFYDTGNTPDFGETWGPKSGGTAFKIYKGYMGFTVTSQVGGTSTYPRVMAYPAFQQPPGVVGYLRDSNFTITNADSATRVIPFSLKGYANGIWPSTTMPKTIEITTGASACFTVRRSGYWKIDASWCSEGSARFSAPYQSKVHRVGIGVYVNGVRTQINGGYSDYYHFSLANADSSPTGGVAIRVPGSLTTGTYLASGDTVDLRVTISEVTADSGTATEGYIIFTQCDFMMQFVGSQLWRNDY